jgi:hypothetical protein
MNTEQLKKEVSKKTADFIVNLNGRFKEFVSDKFLQVYLEKEFMEEYYLSPNRSLANIAYSASSYLFESILEYGCGALGNGHHVAQSYAQNFPQLRLTEINEELPA